MKAGPEAVADKATPGKRMRRADDTWSRKAANTPAAEARRKAMPSESAMAETPTADAAVACEAMPEGQGTGWNRRSADKTRCSERNRYPAQHGGTPFPPSPLTVRQVISSTMAHFPPTRVA